MSTTPLCYVILQKFGKISQLVLKAGWIAIVSEADLTSTLSTMLRPCMPTSLLKFSQCETYQCKFCLFFSQVYIHQREKSSHCQLEKAQVPYQSKPSGDLGQNVSVLSGQEYWLNISKTESFSLNHGALPGVHFFLAPRWKFCCYIL